MAPNKMNCSTPPPRSASETKEPVIHNCTVLHRIKLSYNHNDDSRLALPAVAGYDAVCGVIGLRLDDDDDAVMASGRRNREYFNSYSTVRRTRDRDFESARRNLTIGHSRDTTWSYMTGLGFARRLCLRCPLLFAPVRY